MLYLQSKSYNELVGYSESLLKYVDTVKRETGLEIALEIQSYDFLECPCKCFFLIWLNIRKHTKLLVVITLNLEAIINHTLLSYFEIWMTSALYIFIAPDCFKTCNLGLFVIYKFKEKTFYDYNL